jgi:hypothetical protein
MATRSPSVAADHADLAHDLEVRREACTMGLYVSITLLGALTVTNVTVLHIVWGTTVGLALAHWFAFSLAARLVDPEVDDEQVTRHLAAQIGAALAVAVVCTVPVLLLPDDWERSGARAGAAACIGLVTYGQVRAFGGSKPRALAAGAVTLSAGLIVAGVKHALSH